MGLAASTARLLMLTARKSDLELQMQFINQARLQLANMTALLFNVTSNLDPNAPEVQQINAKIAALQAIDKSLEIQMQRIQVQHQAVTTEIESVQKIISRNIQMSFKLWG